MFDVKVLGSVKGIEGGEEMRFDIQEAVKAQLESYFQSHGLWEVFVVEVTERQVDLPERG